jgi:hypothetical protein
MNAGDTFLMPDAIGGHLYCVLAVLEDNSIIVCHLTTSRRHSDRTCLIHPGEHSFIKQETSVAYVGAYICSAGDQLAAFERQIRKPFEALSADLLARMRNGAVASLETSDKIKDLLKPFIGKG